MHTLDPGQRRRVDAAQGWLMLGNVREAWAEVEQLEVDSRDHPEVLGTCYELLARESRWDEAYPVAEKAVMQDPGSASGWLWRAYAARRMTGGGLRQAFEALLPAVRKFPQEALIPFNLACYCSQLGELDEARTWLSKALALGGEPIRGLAKSDPDLEPLRRAMGEG